MLTINVHHSTICTNLILIRSNGANQKQKEILHKQEEDILPVYWLKRTSCLSLEDGILCYNFTIFLFMILKLKLGLTPSYLMRLPSGTSEVFLLLVFLPGSISSLEVHQEISSKAVTEQAANTKTQFGI